MSRWSPDDLIVSHLSRTVVQDNVELEVMIYIAPEEARWTLEVVDPADNATVWDETFVSDDDALNEFMAALEEDGVEAFLSRECFN